MSNLSSLEIQNFWIRVYLGTTNNNKIKIALIDRAYRDFSRTLHKIKHTIDSYQILKNKMLSIIDYVEHHQFETQEEFDQWHKEKCDELKSDFKKHINYYIYYGQTQKWINMSLKYIFAIYYGTPNGYEKNYKFFHIPIDNIIQEKFEPKGIERITGPWSKLDNYKKYLKYQIRVRETFPNQIPMDIEFKIFNEFDT